MTSKNFCLWIKDEELKILKQKANEENRSIANFIKTKCEVFKNDKRKTS